MTQTGNVTVPAQSLGFPSTPEQITVSWLNQVFQEVGLIDGDAVVSFDALPAPAGFGAVCNSVRVRIEYAAQLVAAPATVFAKFSVDDTHSKRFAKREVLFYQTLADRIDLRIPKCYFAAVDPDTDLSLILLEDLSEGRSGDSVVGSSLADAELLLRNIAPFHAQWWNSPLLTELGWLSKIADNTDDVLTQSNFDRGWELFQEKHLGKLPHSVIPLAGRAMSHAAEILHLLDFGPYSLVHQDLQPDNIMYDLPSTPIAIIDWQLILKGPAARDLAFILSHSLPTEARRAEEDHLIAVYHSGLVQAGIHDYSIEVLRKHMHAFLLFYFLRVIMFGAFADFPSKRSQQHLQAFIERTTAAVKDHQVESSDIFQGVL